MFNVDFVKAAAEYWKNTQEYDGRMETWCWYCGEYQGESGEENNHPPNCLHLKALRLLGEKKNDATV